MLQGGAACKGVENIVRIYLVSTAKPTGLGRDLRPVEVEGGGDEEREAGDPDWERDDVCSARRHGWGGGGCRIRRGIF